MSFSFSVYLSIYIESLRNSGKRRENTSDTHTQGILNYSVRSLYSHTNSYDNAVTQCHVDGALGLPVRPGVTIQNASKQNVHGKRFILPLKKQILGDQENIPCNGNEPKQCIYTWKTRRSDTEITAEICRPTTTSHDLARFNGSTLKFLLRTQHEVPFISTSEATKRSS